MVPLHHRRRYGPGLAESPIRGSGIEQGKNWVFSFLLSAIPDPLAATAKLKDGKANLRVLSESFALPNGLSGRYCCSPKGYTCCATLPCASFFQRRPSSAAPSQSRGNKEEKDEKSGAILLSY
jgi:hypothetical protein